MKFELVEPAPPVTLDMMPEDCPCAIVIEHEGPNIFTVIRKSRRAFIARWDRVSKQWYTEADLYLATVPDKCTVLSRLDGKPLPEVEVKMRDRTPGLYYQGLHSKDMYTWDGAICRLHDGGKNWHVSPETITTGPGYRLVGDEADPIEPDHDDVLAQCKAIQDATAKLYAHFFNADAARNYKGADRE